MPFAVFTTLHNIVDLTALIKPPQILAANTETGYKVSELLSASIYLTEKAGGVIKKIRETGKLSITP